MRLKIHETIHQTDARRSTLDARRSTLDARVRASKLLTLLVLAYISSMTLTVGIQAQPQYTYQVNTGPMSFTVPDSGHNVCVKFVFNRVNFPPAGCNYTCCTNNTCYNKTAIDNNHIVTWNFSNCDNGTMTFCFCLTPGDHTIETDWSCVYTTLSTIEIYIDTRNDCSPENESCTGPSGC